MQLGSVLVHCGCCLGAAVAIRVIEIPGGDGVLTESAFERYAAIRPSRGVVAHSFIVVPLRRYGLGQGELALRVKRAA
jgi:hypothetical protein